MIGRWPQDRRTVAILPADLPEQDVTRWYGVPVTAVARTLVDVGRADRRQALVAADAALADGLVTRAAIGECLERCAGWPGIVSARRVLALADPRSESPLETLTRLCFHDGGLPPPQPQVVVRHGDWWCRVDFYWPGRGVICEADGKLKYRQGEAVWAEKLRQERLERLGFRVVRVSWEDVVKHSRPTLDRVRWALAAGGQPRPDVIIQPSLTIFGDSKWSDWKG